MVVVVGALMFFLGLLIGIIIFMRDESWEIQRKKLLEYIYFQMTVAMRHKRASKDDTVRIRCEGEIMAFEKLRDYIAELSLQEE